MKYIWILPFIANLGSVILNIYNQIKGTKYPTYANFIVAVNLIITISILFYWWLG